MTGNHIFHCTATYTLGSFIVRLVIFTIFIGSQSIDISCFFIPLYKSPDQRISFYTLVSIWVLFTLFWIWSYIVTCWMDAGSVEHALYKLGYFDKKGQFKSNIELSSEIDIFPRCEKCQLPKPPRTHHCSRCNRCYFRFDHHCDVVGNCIAYSNIKSFILFLFYSSLLLFLSVATSIVAYKTTGKIKLAVLLMAVILGIFLGLVIFIFACTFLPEVCVYNRTTLEKISGEDAKRFDAGAYENIRQIFGGCPLLWILPTRPNVDGFKWSVKYEMNEKSKGNMDDAGLMANVEEKKNVNDQESLTTPLNPK